MVEDRGYDNVHPRVSLLKHKTAKGLIARLQSAHENSMESFQFFAAGLIAASLTLVSPSEREMVCQVASLHLISRVAYIGLYAFHKEGAEALSWTRTTFWGIGTMASSFLLLTAGAKYAQLYP